jgi:hypothetical protein
MRQPLYAASLLALAVPVWYREGGEAALVAGAWSTRSASSCCASGWIA